MTESFYAPYQFDMPIPQKGFTLVEMVVSVGLFAVVMMVCVGSLLALMGANRKVQALQVVMNNLNVTLDGMVRAVRMGSTYHCGSTGIDTIPLQPANCIGGDTQFAFLPYGSASNGFPWKYRFDANTNILYRSQNGAAEMPLTSSQVQIDSMQFFVDGTVRGCDTPSPCTPIQPKVMMVVKGTAPVLNTRARTSFHIQVTAVQRVIDI